MKNKVINIKKIEFCFFIILIVVTTLTGLYTYLFNESQGEYIREPIVLFFTAVLDLVIISIWLLVRNKNWLDGIFLCFSEMHSNIKKNRLSWKTLYNIISHRAAGIILVLVFLFTGTAIYKDYGVSTDEGAQLKHSRVAYKYIFSDLLELSKSNNVKNFIENTQEFETYGARFYGTALQIPLVAIEHLNDFTMTTSEIFAFRHLYVYFNFMLGALCFYLLLRKRFKDNPIAFFGMLMYVLYPRFFGEAFYNIKDSLFFSWYIIAAFFAIQFIEKRSVKRMLLFAGSVAICNNVRVIGVSIALLVLAYIILLGIVEKQSFKKTFITCSSLIFSFLAISAFINPAFWGNPFTTPIKGFISTFSHFSYYERWSGGTFYLGEMITRDVPWHYIPVWMSVTIPVLYILLFLVGCFGILLNVFRTIKMKKTQYFETMCDSFFVILLFASYFGLLILKSAMYSSWRHSYFLFASFLYISVFGLYHVYKIIMDFKNTHRAKLITQIIFYGCFVGYISTLIVWNIINYPFQYVYFNEVGRYYAEDNFQLDYWRVSTHESIKEMLRVAENEEITVCFVPVYDFENRFVLTEEEESRIKRTKLEYAPEYIVTNSRDDIKNRRAFKGYEKIYSVNIDGFDITALHKYIIRPECFLPNIQENVNSVNRRIIEFKEPVKHNLIRFNDSIYKYSVSVSSDGIKWETPKIVFSNNKDVVIAPLEYRFIRFNGYNIYEEMIKTGRIKFGNINVEEFK